MNGTAIPLTSASGLDRGPFMDPTSIPPTPMLEDTPPSTARPMLQAAAASSQRSPPSRVDPPKPNAGMQVRGPSDIELLEEEEERRREQEDGRWWTDWMCGCKESGGQGHGQVCHLSPWYTAAGHLLIVRRRDGPTRSSNFRDICINVYTRVLQSFYDRIIILTNLIIRLSWSYPIGHF